MKALAVALSRGILIGVLMSTAPGLWQSAEARGVVRLESFYESWAWDESSDAGKDAEDVSAGVLTSRLSVGYLDLIRGLDLEVALGVARSRWTRDGEAGDREIGGATDTRLRLSYRAGDCFLARLGVSLPTGRTELTQDEELPLAQLLTSRVLASRLNRFGQGADIDLGTSFATTAGPATVGFGVGYLFRGGFAMVEQGDVYEPGDQLSLAAGVDLSDPDWLARLDLRFVSYGEDEMGQEVLDDLGHRLDWQALLLRRWERMSVWLALGLTMLEGSDQQITHSTTDPGREMSGDIGLRRALSDRLTLLLQANARDFGGEGGQADRGRRFTWGGGLAWRCLSSVMIEGRGTYTRGRLEKQWPEMMNLPGSPLSGVGLFGTITVEF